MLVFIQKEACSRGAFTDIHTFTDEHSGFNQSFFGIKTVVGLLVRDVDLVINPSVVMSYTAESNITVFTILNNGMLVTLP